MGRFRGYKCPMKARFLITTIALLLLAGCGDNPEKQARDVFLFGYPLVMMDETRKASNSPANQFRHMRTFPDHNFRTVVRPNIDTLYSIAWLDLGDEALILEVPESDGRYYLLPILDAWSNVFASIGTRTTGGAAGQFLLVGPDWDGDVPDGLTLYRSPTRMAWMIGRVYTAGSDDLAGAHKFQDGLRLSTVAVETLQERSGATEGAGNNVGTLDVKEKLRTMPAPQFFEALDRLMIENPPAQADAAFMEETMRPLRENNPSPEILEKGKDRAYGRLDFIERLLGRKKGWSGMTGSSPVGNYGTNYQARAYVAHVGFGANEPADAIYPNTARDANGDDLHSSHSYRLRMAKKDLPPVNGFWSITMYDDEGFLVENEIARYSLSARDPLVYDADGSLTIMISADAPAGGSANWLPAPPDAPFALTMRLFWPQDAALNGAWSPPDVEKL